MGGADVPTDGGDSTTVAGEEVTVNIRCSNGSKFSVQVKLDSTVEIFKSILAEKCEIPPPQQRLIYKGRILKEGQTLQSYGLEADHTVHLVRGLATAAPAENVATANAGVRSSNTTPSTDAGLTEGRPLGGSSFGSSLFPGLGVNGLGSDNGLFGAAFPGMEQIQQQLTQNPNMIRDFLNMPSVQNLMNNPDTIRNLIMNNPQMREVMERNPELAHVLNDPATLRQTMEAVRNPEIMREMMRNTDRAMSNIESSPEGFNMLRRMYENVQEPFLNATTMTGDNRSDLGTNPFAALLGNRGQEPRRENSTGSGAPGSETATTAPAPNTNPLPNPWASAGTGGVQTNSGIQSNPTGNARPTSPGATGLTGFPEFEQMLGSTGTGDNASLNQIMQNPAVSQMMRNLLSSPEYINQVLGLDPQLQSMLNANPQLREMMQNPEFLRQMTSPETMQQLLNFYQALSSQIRPQTAREGGQNAGGTDAGMEMLMNMFGALGTGGGNVPSNRSQAPPEELYATQLSQLQEMGFFDTQENLQALMATAGNVHAAVERLLGNSGR